MKSLGNLAHRPRPSGIPLPDVFTVFKEHNIRPRRGSVCMIVAEPGVGKTFLGMYWTARMNMRELFFSADSDEDTMMERAGAMVSGMPQTEVRELLRNDPHSMDDSFAELDQIRWVFDEPTYDDLVLEIMAYTEVMGDWPEIVVVDNLMNVIGDQENEWSAMRETARALKHLAHQTGAAVFVLHHVGEDGKDTDLPPARSRIQGKVAQLPPLILSLAHVEERGVMRVAPLKNRWGRGDKSGRTFVEIPCDLARARFFNSTYDKATGRAA